MGLKADIIAILTSSDATLTDFSLFGQRVFGGHYRDIASSIRNGHVQIVRSGSMPSTLAAYNRTLNCFTVGAAPSPSLIVHEATHAINDWHGHTLAATDDEGLAYVAQMIFTCRRTPAIRHAALTDLTRQRILESARTCGRSRQRSCSTATIGYATTIAATLLDNRTPPDRLLREFQNSLAVDPFTVEPTVPRAYDRIRRVEIPLAYLVEIAGQLVAD